MKTLWIAVTMFLAAATVCAQAPSAAQQPAAAGQQPAQSQAQSREPGMDLVRQGQQLAQQGKRAEALKLYEQAMQQNPNFYQAHAASGVALDLEGRYGEARQHLQKAIDVASPQQKPGALRSMAMSYAFEKKAGEAAKYEQQLIDADLGKTPPDYDGAADIGNELARVYLESGDLDNALKTYGASWENIQKKPGLKPEERALWEFRWENAQARIGARRGNKAEAQKHVEAARAAMEKMSARDKEQQQPYWPYLTGYVGFYNGDYQQAVTELAKGNQRDPFVLALEAQAYEKLGQKDKANDLYRQVLTINGHNPTGAFSRPLARQRLGNAAP